MIHAVDTNILLDILLEDSEYYQRSADLLAQVGVEGALVISAVAYAELSAHFDHDEDIQRFLMDVGVRVEPINIEVARVSGRAWHAYIVEKKTGNSRRDASKRKPILADFLIGAHAIVGKYVLLTRDTRGLYERYFPSLKCVG